METEFTKLAKSRYSLKKFSDQPVEEEKLMAILEAGNLAPTAKDSQPHRVYAVTSPTVLEKLGEGTPCIYGATAVLVVTYDPDEVFVYPDGDQDSGAEDAAIVATHMMLEAKAQGVDSCWVNFFHSAPVKAAAGIPDKEKVIMLLDLGYPAEGAGPLANHTKRKPLEDTVKIIK